ncbi:hypothetical protein ACU4GD_05655 [Cupriavidus basilensis]
MPSASAPRRPSSCTAAWASPGQYDPQLYFKRAQARRRLAGGAAAALARIADGLLAA